MVLTTPVKFPKQVLKLITEVLIAERLLSNYYSSHKAFMKISISPLVCSGAPLWFDKKYFSKFLNELLRILYYTNTLHHIFI